MTRLALGMPGGYLWKSRAFHMRCNAPQSGIPQYHEGQASMQPVCITLTQRDAPLKVHC
jgi:hypothetical protein